MIPQTILLSEKKCLVLDISVSNTSNHLTICKQVSSNFFINKVSYGVFAYKLYIYIYMPTE